jgi:hypothetical protein
VHYLFDCEADVVVSLGGTVLSTTSLHNLTSTSFLSALGTSLLSMKILNNNNFYLSTFQLLLSPDSNCFYSSCQNMFSNPLTFVFNSFLNLSLASYSRQIMCYIFHPFTIFLPFFIYSYATSKFGSFCDGYFDALATLCHGYCDES